MITRAEAIKILYGTAVLGYKEAMTMMGENYAGVTFKDVLFAMGVQEGEFNRVMWGENGSA